MRKSKDNVIMFQYKYKKPKRLENDVFVIYSPQKLTLKPGETTNLNMRLNIFLPRHVEGRCTLLLSHSQQNLRLLNSNLITQKYNRNIEIDNNDSLPAWSLNFELQNGNYTNELTIKNKQELAYFSLLLFKGEEITYKFQKKN